MSGELDLDDVAATSQRALAELEALRADAERYRWLRDNYASVGFEGRMLLWDQRDPAAGLDVYIDEARKVAP